MPSVRFACQSLLLLLAVPLLATAQPVARARIGYLSPSSPAAAASLVEGFRQGLREHGYVEGANTAIEYRFAHGDFERLPGMAAELVELRVDVLVAMVTQASIAAKSATSTIPVVMVGVSDPLGAKLVETLSRPGGNVTGNSALTAATAGKSLELLKEVAPNVRRVAALWNPANEVFQAQLVRETQAAARSLNLELILFEFTTPEAIPGVFEAMARQRVGALNVLADPTMTAHAAEISRRAAAARLPSIGWQASFADAGGLIAYGSNLRELHRDAAAYVARILAGAKPGELPVEQPRTFDLVVNMKTARQLAIAIPAPFLLRATRVIEP
jgi:putative ABC transport system substrate-binding protein